MMRWLVIIFCSLITGVIFYFSNPLDSPFDYTLRIADAMLHGQLGLQSKPPRWLNEFVPFAGNYYSVFPLGNVLVMLPLAAIRLALDITEGFPSRWIVACTAAAITWLSGLLAFARPRSNAQAFLLTLFPLLCTCAWANLAFGGAWQLALGFCVLGQLLALCFILIDRRPFWAGVGFALSFGTRTETLLLAPLFMWLLYRERPEKLKDLVYFCSVPFCLGVATMTYNYLRFFMPFDFGYSRIPGVLNEPWYQDGIFSIRSIGLNAREMLWTPWKWVRGFPYLTPTGFGGSIFLSTPLLIYLFRRRPTATALTTVSWLAILILTTVLWCHGNPGGWQFSYRYAMVMLPWAYLIFLETSPLTVPWIVLWLVSLGINAYATYLFHWTRYVNP